MKALFEPLQIGKMTIQNRIIHAPMTRVRATPHTHIPEPVMAEYYAQRAAAGLVIAEATTVADKQSGFGSEPGCYNIAQAEAWRKIVGAVHAKKSKMVLQLYHPGRINHLPNVCGQGEVLAPSAVKCGQPTAAGYSLSYEKHECHVPRALADEELPVIVDQFVNAAKLAIDVAGFDGVEIHCANGYLLSQFLDKKANIREGAYGGSVEGRAKFPLEVVETVAKAVGSDKVGVRISPTGTYNDMDNTDPVPMTKHLCENFSALNLAYVHLHAGFLPGDRDDYPTVLGQARESFQSGKLIVCGGYNSESAQEDVAAKKVDAVAFGRHFIANPDLVDRIKNTKPLADPNMALAYLTKESPEKGYTDYTLADGKSAIGVPPPKEKKEKKPAAKAANADLTAAQEATAMSRCSFLTGTVLEVSEHPESEKLWVEQIDLGEEKPRQILSGLRAHITKEEFTGRRVLCAANLAPRKMAGIESAGMVLCASSADGKIKLLDVPEGVPNGTRITFEGHTAPAEPVLKKKLAKNYDEVAPLLKTNDKGEACWGELPFMTEKGPVACPDMSNATVS